MLFDKTIKDYIYILNRVALIRFLGFVGLDKMSGLHSYLAKHEKKTKNKLNMALINA